MNVIQLFINDANFPRIKIAALSVISGLSSSLIMAVVNSAVENARDDELIMLEFFMFVILLGIFIITMHQAYMVAADATEQVLYNVRLRIANKVRNAKLRFIEEQGKARIYGALTQDINSISQGVIAVRTILQASSTLLFVFLYILWISPVGFFLIGIAALVSALAYSKLQVKSKTALAKLSEADRLFLYMLEQLLDGLKELRVNHVKSQDLLSRIDRLSDHVRHLKHDSNHVQVSASVFGQAAFYIMMGATVFVLPLVFQSYGDTVNKLVMAIFFFMGSLGALISELPELARINAAAENLGKLEADLDRLGYDETSKTPASTSPFKDFQAITLKDVHFNYAGPDTQEGFGIGPIDLQINAGQLLFIVGGNGSGKSTLLKVLSGLYFPSQGEIHVDDQLIQDQLYTDYRELFSLIFADFHLFDRLYGIQDIADERINALIRLMQLEQKVYFQDGKFSSLDLSTGQRKRLAYIVARLEDRPIYIFDEWAADQDPEFRNYFYYTLLPDLKDAGKTIIAVSHDDRYFHLGDHVIKMDYGSIVSYS